MIVAHEYIRSITKDIQICGKAINFLPANKKLIEDFISSNAADNNIESYPLIVMQTPKRKDTPNGNLKRIELNSQRFILAMETELNYSTDERYEKNFKPILFPLMEAFKKEMNKSNRVARFNIISYEDIEYLGNTDPVGKDKWDYIEIFADVTLIENEEC